MGYPAFDGGHSMDVMDMPYGMPSSINRMPSLIHSWIDWIGGCLALWMVCLDLWMIRCSLVWIIFFNFEMGMDIGK